MQLQKQKINVWVNADIVADHHKLITVTEALHMDKTKCLTHTPLFCLFMPQIPCPDSYWDKARCKCYMTLQTEVFQRHTSHRELQVVSIVSVYCSRCGSVGEWELSYMFDMLGTPAYQFVKRRSCYVVMLPA